MLFNDIKYNIYLKNKILYKILIRWVFFTVDCLQISEGPCGLLIESSKAHSISISFVNTLEKQHVLFVDRNELKTHISRRIQPTFCGFYAQSESTDDGCSAPKWVNTLMDTPDCLAYPIVYSVQIHGDCT